VAPEPVVAAALAALTQALLAVVSSNAAHVGVK
jgi:hypothetical protein